MNPENPVDQLSTLTERQREVLHLFCEGLDYKSIGDKLFIALSTVKAHMGHIYVKLELDHLPPAKRRLVLVERYCVLLKGVELSEAPPDEADKLDPVPEQVLRMVEEDERAIIPWESTTDLVEPQVVLMDPRPLPSARHWTVLLRGMGLGATLTIVVVLVIVGITYLLGGFSRSEGLGQDIQTPVVAYTQIVVVTATAADTSTATAPTSTTALTSPTPYPTYTPLPTYTALPTYTPHPVSTATPRDPTSTPTPRPPTSTPPPTPTEEPFKRLGYGYSADGVALILSDYSISSSTTKLYFVVKNESRQSILVRYQNSYFQLYDDLGNHYERDAQDLYVTKQRQIEPGKAVDIVPNYGAAGRAFNEIGWFQGVIPEDAKYLVVLVSKFAGLQDLEWRIPLAP